MPDINVSDAVFIAETIEWAYHPEIVNYEDIIVSESFEYAKEVLDVDVFTLTTIYQDIVEFGFTPKSIDIFDEISAIDIALPPDLTEVGISVDNISVAEKVTIAKDISFNDLLRSYPFVTRTATGIVSIEYDNGVVQERDTWGRKKRIFEINFPPMTKSEAVDVQAFFDNHIGTIFQFTNPIDGITYDVRILDKEFVLERRYFNIYFGRIAVAEVF